MNKLFKNKFLRENLVLLIILGLIFPQYAFSDAWVADTGNEQISRLYKDGHAPTVISVEDVGIDGDTILVNMNPTALFYPGLKLSFGMNRADVYEIDSVDSDPNVGWTVTFTSPISEDVTDSPIYMELVRAGGFAEPVSVSTNTYNTKVWIADNSVEDSGITQLTGWGRDEPSDTPLLKPIAPPFSGGDSIFELYSQDMGIYPGIKMDFNSDNRDVTDTYVLETEDVDKSFDPYILTTYSGLPNDHSIIGKEASVIHIDRFRDKVPISPKDVSANSISNRNNSEYDTAWAAAKTGHAAVMSSIAFDNASSATINFAQTCSWSHTCSGSNRILFIDISQYNSIPTSVTYNGVNLTLLRRDSISSLYYSEIWYLVNPPTGAHTASVTLSSSNRYAVCGAISYTGVDQTSPIDNSNGASGTGTAISASVNVLTENSWVMAVKNSPTATTSCSDTIRYGPTSAGPVQQAEGADKNAPQTTGSKTISFTQVANAPWAESIVSFKPATLLAGSGTENGSLVKYTQDWQYRRMLIIDPTGKIDEDLINFPLCVKLDSSSIDYSNTQNAGEDIRFTDSKGTLLRYEIENWNETDTSVVWVKVPLISSDTTNPTIIYMYYGNPNALDAQDRENVWDGNYTLVQHMRDGSSDTNILDSTFNNNDGTKKAASEPVEADAQIAKGQNFDSVDDYVNCGNSESLKNTTFSAFAWIKPTAVNNTYAIAGTRTINTGSWAFYIRPTGKLGFTINLVNDYNSAWASLPANQWSFVGFTVISGGVLNIYYNGASIYTTTVGTLNPANYGYLGIGTHEGTIPAVPFAGIIDEVRISDIARSDAWIKADYYSENNNLIEFGNEENIRYADLLKVGGFNSPQAISVNSSNGEAWVADSGNLEIVKLSKNGHQTINATVIGDYAPDDFQIILSDVLELDTGIKISFNNYQEDAYKIIDIVTSSNWWNENWAFRKKLTFDKFSSGENLVDFPVMVKLTPQLAEDNYFDYSRSLVPYGADIRFVEADNSDTLPYEIEEWEEYDTSIIWVKAPEIARDEVGEDSNYIWMYYGNPAATDEQDTTNVWDSNFKLVTHMKDTPNTSSVKDSTENANNGTKTAANKPIETDGKISKAQNFFEDSVQVQASTVIGTSTTANATQYPHQRKTFYAAGLYWVWYVDGTGFGYRTSADAVAWSSFQSVGAVSGGGYSGSVCFDGTYVHYVRYTSPIGNPSLYYRRGTPVSDGSITWSAAEQLIIISTGNYSYIAPMITVDSNGYAWIGMYRSVSTATTTQLPIVFKNANNDGTWSTQGGFPYLFSATNDATWRVSIVPLEGGKVYAIYSRNGQPGLGRLWNGSWGSEETTMADAELGYGHSAVADGEDIYLVYLNNTLATGIMYNKRTGSTGLWGTEATVQANAAAATAPTLSLDTATGNLYCFWVGAPTAGHIYYKKGVNGTWDASPTDTNWNTQDVQATQSLESGGDLYESFYADTWLSQSFISTIDDTLWQVQFYGKRGAGSLSVLINVGIYAADGENKPTGPALYTGTIPNYTFSIGRWFIHTLTTPLSVLAGQRYCLVLSAPTGLSTQYYQWYVDSTSPPYTDGNWADSTDAGLTWTADNTKDGLFRALFESTFPSDALSCFYQSYGSQIGVEYMTRGVSPYNVEFGFLQLPPPVKVDMGSDASLELTTAGTLEAWVSTSGTTDNNMYIVGTEDITTDTNGYSLSAHQNRILLEIADDSDSNRIDVTPSPSLGTTWHNIVGVWDNYNLNLYLDGTNIGNTIQTLNPNPISDSGLWIGADPQNVFKRNFNGTIDEVRISEIARSDSWIKAQYNSMIDNFITYGSEEENISSIVIDPLRNYVLDGSSVARELARIGGFTNPVAVAVDFDLDDCWVIDDNDTVILINGTIGDDPTTAYYNIKADYGYHRIITGLNKPVSVAVDPLFENCWVACEGDGVDTYIVRLDRDVGINGYALNGNRHTKIYGFSSPNAVSVDPSTGECWVSDSGNSQIVRLSPEGHKYTGYIVDEIGLDTVILELEDSVSETNDTTLYKPLKISFGNFTTDIKPVYQILTVTSLLDDKVEIKFSPPLTVSISGGIKVYKELARVGGFFAPSDVSAFKGEDLELGLHPWGLQVREFYYVDGEKIPAESDDGWKHFPANTPIHDATPQFRWKYIDIDGDYVPLESYRIRIWTRDVNGEFVSTPVWDSTTVNVTSEIYPRQWIYTDWDKVSLTTKENDSTSIYSDEYSPPPGGDVDDCPDLSQVEDSAINIGDRKYFVQLTVTNTNNARDTYPTGAPLPDDALSANSEDTPIITFTLDKTPPGAYRVCGTGPEVLMPATEEYNIKIDRNDVIATPYLQTDNYYWDQVWIEWDGGETEIVDNTSLWIPKKQVTVRVKVQDRNNENLPEGTDPEHKGHDATSVTEFAEDEANCSGISLNAQYRYSRASSLPPPNREWSEWKDCDEVRRYDEEALLSNGQGERLLQGGVKNEFVWLYAKNVLLADGDTNLIQFRVLDEGYMEVNKIAKYDVTDTAEVWIAPNMGYSHADTIIEDVSNIEYQTSSNIYGYKLKIDSNIPQVILMEYPSSSYPHSFASLKWIALDSTPCRFKWVLQYWDDVNTVWKGIDDHNGDAGDGEDHPQGYLSDDAAAWDDEATSVSFDGLKVGGLYRFWVKAKDLDGAECDSADISRRVSIPAVWVWRVSPEAPDTIITYGPSGQVEKGNVKFTWTGVGGMPPYTYYWRLRGPSTFPEQNSTTWVSDTKKDFTPSNLDAGTYVFEVRAREQNHTNNFDLTPAKRIFTVVDPSHPPYSAVSPQNLYKYFREIGE